jgi:hypothetical protein
MQYLAKYAERRIFCLKTTETISIIVKMISTIDWIIPTIGKVISAIFYPILSIASGISLVPKIISEFPLGLSASFHRWWVVHRWVVK